MSDVSSFRRYFQITRRYFGRSCYGIIGLNLLVGAAESFGILLVVPLLHRLNIGGTDVQPISEFVYRFCAFAGLPPTAAGVLLLVVLAFALKGLLVFSASAYLRLGVNAMRCELKDELTTGIAGVDYRYSMTKSRGYFGHLIVNDLNRASWAMSNYCRCLAKLVSSLCLMISAICIQPGLSGAIVAAACANAVVLRFTARIAKRYSLIQSELGAASANFLLEMLDSFKYLKSTSGFSALTIQSAKMNRRLAAAEDKVALANAAFEAVREPILVILIAAIAYYHVILHGSPLAPVVAAVGLLYRCMVEFGTFQWCWQAVCDSSGGIEVLSQAHQEIEEHQEHRTEQNFPESWHALQLNDVRVAYDGCEILCGIDLSIQRNTSVALVGLSGCGKTTLLNAIASILRPRSGRIAVDGIVLEAIDPRAYRSRVGYVTQENAVFSDTVVNNISMNLGGTCDAVMLKRVKAAAQLSHCEEFIAQLPDGYETHIGERGVRLSVGQRQRLAIARELYRKPEILLLDESTSSLDALSEEYIRESLQSLRGQMTLIIVSHRLSSLNGVDVVHVLEDGRIVESGSIGELLNTPQSRFNKLSQLQQLEPDWQSESSARAGGLR